MGRPIRKNWFGDPALPGFQIEVNGIKWADGSTSTSGSIVRQPGSTAYVVTDGIKEERCFLANADDVADLLPGQCFILATPFGGTALPCQKISQFRLSVYNVVGSPSSSITSYSWSTIPATRAGEADLIDPNQDVPGVTATGTAVSLIGRVTSITVDAPGSGYTSAPTVGFTGGGGTGATATAVLGSNVGVDDDQVVSIVINTAGSGYATAPTVTFSAGAATATAVLTADAVTSVTIGTGGVYLVLPTVTFSAP